jgi:hypothetical protein
VKGHPENKDVMLRIMSLSDWKMSDEKVSDGKVNGEKISVLAKLFGGQGTINVPSWSPDSRGVAFVSYALVPDEHAGKK